MSNVLDGQVRIEFPDILDEQKEGIERKAKEFDETEMKKEDPKKDATQVFVMKVKEIDELIVKKNMIEKQIYTKQEELKILRISIDEPIDIQSNQKAIQAYLVGQKKQREYRFKLRQDTLKGFTLDELVPGRAKIDTAMLPRRTRGLKRPFYPVKEM